MEWLKLQHYLHHLNSTRLGALETDYGVGVYSERALILQSSF